MTTYDPRALATVLGRNDFVLRGDGRVRFNEASSQNEEENWIDLTALPNWSPPAYDAALTAAERDTMVVSPFQAEQALADAGMLPRVQSLINSKDTRTQRAWERSPSISRNSPLVASLAASLGLTPEQVDDLFRAAMQIKA